MKIRLSLGQTQIQFRSPDQNIEASSNMIQEAAGLGSQLILFPELWLHGYDLRNCKVYAHETPKYLQQLLQLAKDNHIFVGGSILEESDSEPFNTFYLLNDEGQVVTKYRKTHLFHLMDEHVWLKAGTNLQTIQFPWGNCGMAICYDLRFPELFRSLALKGCTIILIVSEWPLSRIEHWRTLLRARAIENQLFIAAVNSVGQTGTETYGGCSAIISPWGEILAEGNGEKSQLVTTDLDFDLVEQTRKTIPIFSDRRSDIYGDLEVN
jgi:omega-amidase